MAYERVLFRLIGEMEIFMVRMAVIKETAAVPMAVWKEKGSPPFYELERMGQSFHGTPKDSFSAPFLFHGLGAADDTVGFRA